MFSFCIRSFHLKPVQKTKIMGKYFHSLFDHPIRKFSEIQNTKLVKIQLNLFILLNIWKSTKIIMCTGENWGCLDDVCCPLRTKAIFFAFWTLVHQVLGLLSCIYYGMKLYHLFGNINILSLGFRLY